MQRISLPRRDRGRLFLFSPRSLIGLNLKFVVDSSGEVATMHAEAVASVFARYPWRVRGEVEITPSGERTLVRGWLAWSTTMVCGGWADDETK